MSQQAQLVVGGAMNVLQSYQRRSRRVACSLTKQLRYPMEAGDRTIPTRLGRHEASCLHCQADAIRYRQIMRGLREMTDTIETTPHDLAMSLDTVALATSHQDGELKGRRGSTRAALASAASLAAIGVAVVAGRRLLGAH